MAKEVKKEDLLCKYAHCECDMWGSELCCEKDGNRYCKFDRRDTDIDYSKCDAAVLVTRSDWMKYAREREWI